MRSARVPKRSRAWRQEFKKFPSSCRGSFQTQAETAPFELQPARSEFPEERRSILSKTIRKTRFNIGDAQRSGSQS